jgi:hypothetical protein
MAGHLSTRIWTAATTPVVRELGPVLTNVFKTVVQFIVAMLLGGVILIVRWLVSSDVPPYILTPLVFGLALVPMGFGFIVVGDMVWMTYRKPEEVVYPAVEAFEDREPREIPDAGA